MAFLDIDLQAIRSLMANRSENIHPDFEGMLRRADKEKLLGQRAWVLWLTGLSGSGKSTIAKALERKLYEAGRMTALLDGDNIRSGLNRNLGFSEEERVENIRRIAEVAKLFLENGIITLASFVSPGKDIREMARQIIGPDDFFEIFVDCPLEECEARDVKGLYKKARAGEIRNFTGIDAPFEAPEAPALTLYTKQESVEESVRRIMEFLKDKIELR